jgi:hypothetical protein
VQVEPLIDEIAKRAGIRPGQRQTSSRNASSVRIGAASP